MVVVVSSVGVIAVEVEEFVMALPGSYEYRLGGHY